MNKLRTKRTWLGGAPLLPLIVLFGLNIVDELDRIAFGILSPEIRDDFGVSESALIAISTLSAAFTIIAIIPAGHLADKHDRLKMSRIAASLWTVMGAMTGVAGMIVVFPLLIGSRFGAGLGRTMNEPVHSSLLADYYHGKNRSKAYAIHRLANPVALLISPLVGLIAHKTTWETTFLILAIPTFVVIAATFKLRQPEREQTHEPEPEPTGTSNETTNASPATIRKSFRTLKAIPTIKISWTTAFFLGVAVVPIEAFFSFFYEQEFGLSAFGRGIVNAVYGLGIATGLIISGYRASKIVANGNPQKLAYGAATTLGIGSFGIVFAANAPWLIGSVIGAFVAGCAGMGFLAYHLPLTAAAAPPECRSQAFAWFGFWFAVGAVTLSLGAAKLGDLHGYQIAVTALSVFVAIAALNYTRIGKHATHDTRHGF